MTAYNASRYIEEAIQSLVQQTYTDFELLIVDDGSTDNTHELILSFNDTRIRVIQNDKNEGLIYSRNIALAEAKGRYLAIIDSDDIALPDRLELQVNEFKRRDSLALLGTPAYHIDQHSKRTKKILEVPSGADIVACKLLFYNTFVHSSVMMKTSIFRSIGGYRNYRFAQDYDLMIRISHGYEVDNLQTPLVEYRTHDSNISSMHSSEQASYLQSIKFAQLDELEIPQKAEYVRMLLHHPSSTVYNIPDYQSFIILLINKNKDLGVYPENTFEKILFDLWYEVLLYKGKRHAIIQLFDVPMFFIKNIELKQLRRILKLSIKSFVRPKIEKNENS
ncbi:Beta-1,3-glucosyltransferase [Sphingobacterium sp. JB170]|nr:Beta-1,3-glucosyltransferase [Sphingobacterium sp. JB170]